MSKPIQKYSNPVNLFKPKQIELLAPAKNFDCGKAAIDAGADALYIGASRFGARSAAGNTVGEIEKLCQYAHRFNAKVYAALNTLLFDREVEEAVGLIFQLYEAGTDALIIQDMALMEAELPPIPLHASTQTNNLELNHIQFLEQLGFSRVILGRELSLKQIEEIRNHTSVELESFVHGALCVSHSGQCYLSYAMNGRSANRGECAQPCRLAYDLEDSAGNLMARNKHLLSLKDLNLSDSIPELLQAGVTSFKIEGRLKDIAYVRNVTASYRKIIDNALNNNDQLVKASSGSVAHTFEPDLEKTFNRGYTTFFILGRQTEIASFNSPKSTGKKIGTVTEILNHCFKIQAVEQLNNNDGLCFFDKNGVLQGLKVNRVEGDRVFPSAMSPDLEPGMDIFRNSDHLFSKKLESETSSRKLAVEMKFFKEDRHYRLECVDENKNVGTAVLEDHFSEARDRERSLQTIREQLSKLGQTIYTAVNIEIQLTEVPFIPAAQLNELRREAITALSDAQTTRFNEVRLKQGQAAFDLRHTADAQTIHYPKDQLGFEANVVNQLAMKFYQRHGVKTIDPGLELQSDFNQKQLMTSHHCLKYAFGLCSRERQKKAREEFQEPFWLKSNHRRYRLDFDCRNCVMNVIG